ncbi:hypothetical protein SOHN41_03622 [Shewanella sp. HN-41]|nr:hypothetical protein SOHN41_03622 [Shewanella sp. HN-41]
MLKDCKNDSFFLTFEYLGWKVAILELMLFLGLRKVVISKHQWMKDINKG